MYLGLTDYKIATNCCEVSWNYFISPNFSCVPPKLLGYLLYTRSSHPGLTSLLWRIFYILASLQLSSLLSAYWLIFIISSTKRFRVFGSIINWKFDEFVKMAKRIFYTNKKTWTAFSSSLRKNHEASPINPSPVALA